MNRTVSTIRSIARLAPMILLLLLALTGVSEARSLRIGDRLAPVSLPDLNGRQVASAAQPGKTVVLYFWTDACGCREQLLELRPYVAGLKQRPVLFHAVNAGQEKGKVSHFVAENRIPYEVLLDDRARLAREQFGIKVLPTIFVIDKGGVLREKLIGVVETKKLQAIINRYL